MLNRLAKQTKESVNVSSFVPSYQVVLYTKKISAFAYGIENRVTYSIAVCDLYTVPAVVAAGQPPADGSCPFKYYDRGCTATVGSTLIATGTAVA
jgi:hypothetical protein